MNTHRAPEESAAARDRVIAAINQGIHSAILLYGYKDELYGDQIAEYDRAIDRVIAAARGVSEGT